MTIAVCLCAPVLAGPADAQESVTSLLLSEQSEARAASMWLGHDPDEPRTAILASWSEDAVPSNEAPAGWHTVGADTSLWRHPFAGSLRVASTIDPPREIRGPRAGGRLASIGGLYKAPRPVRLGETPFSVPGIAPTFITPLPLARVSGGRPVPGDLTTAPRTTATVPNK
ncbi:hypothetical protein ABI59_12165 [Acidobacteria bacterium Mor1]|nr:hypothetical protein ABI59_12165 [Acidobacteria bacterium Mor1]